MLSPPEESGLGDGEVIIGTEVPTYKVTLRAICRFGRAGSIKLIEHFENEGVDEDTGETITSDDARKAARA
jgi:hypothetical protein